MAMWRALALILIVLVGPSSGVSSYVFAQQKPTNALKLSQEELDQSVILVATTREKLVKILLHNFSEDVTLPLDKTLRGLNDPAHPIRQNFSLQVPVIQSLLKKYRPEIEAKINSYVNDPMQTSALISKYEKMLGDFHIGVDGHIAIQPHFESGRLDIDKQLTEEEKKDEAKLKKPIPAEELPLARADFKLFAEPELNFSNLKFYTLENPGEKRNEIRELNLDLSHVRLGNKVWFYVISNLEQVFQRTEDQPTVRRSSAGSDFKPKLTAAEAGRMLKKGKTDTEFDALVSKRAPVYILGEVGANGEVQESWLWTQDKSEHDLEQIKKKDKFKYLVKADVDFKKLEAPFYFRESWFGSNLSQNYLDPSTVKNIVNQVFKPEVWATLSKIFMDSSKLQGFVLELEKDFNQTFVPKLKTKKILVNVFGQRMPDGKVVAHYETNTIQFEAKIKSIKEAGNLVYALKAHIPLAIQSAKIKFEKPLNLIGEFQMEKKISVEFDLLYADSKLINFESIDMKNSSFRGILEGLPPVDFLENPIKITADVHLSEGVFRAKLPITWQEHGADLDEEKIEIDLSPLEKSSLQNLKISMSGANLDTAKWGADLPEFLKNSKKTPVPQLIDSALAKSGPAIEKYALQFLSKMMDPSTKAADRVFSISTTDKIGAKFTADISLKNIAFTESNIQCHHLQSEPESLLDISKLPEIFQNLAAKPAILRWTCSFEPPTGIKVEIRNLKSKTGSISHAYGSLLTRDKTRLQVTVKLVQASDGKIWVVPEELPLEQLLSRYKLEVKIPDDSVIIGTEMKARIAQSVQNKSFGIASRLFKNQSLGASLATKTNDKIREGQESAAMESLKKGWEDAKSGIIDYALKQAFYEIPPSVFTKEIPLIPERTVLQPEGDSGVSIAKLEVQAGKRISQYVHNILHGDPADDFSRGGFDLFSQKPWKKILEDELYVIPYRYSKDIDETLFNAVQEQGLEKLSDTANEMFRTDLQPQVQGMASSLFLQGRDFALPKPKSVCLIQPSANNLNSDVLAILMTAQSNLAPVVKIPEDQLPSAVKDKSHKQGHMYLALGFDYLNETLKANREQMRALIEEAIKYDVNPDTGVKKKRKFISEKNFKVEYADARLERQANGEPMIVIDTRLSQPFKFLGPIFGAPFKPLFNLDTKNVQIRISPTHEFLTFVDDVDKNDFRKPDPGLLVQTQTGNSRKLELQKHVFRSVLTQMVLKAAKKKLGEQIAIPMSTTVQNSDNLKFHLREMSFEKNWVTVDIEPELNTKIQKPFTAEFRFDTPTPPLVLQ